jgi:putative ABC transport system substrate-binding protein
MRRREFIVGGSGLLACPVSGSRAQSVKKSLALVKITKDTSYPPVQAFFDALRKLGYVEGESIVTHLYATEGSSERRAQVARDAVLAIPDVIFVITGAITQDVKDASSTIPIITMTSDPIALGFTASLAHPSANVTGVVVDAGIEHWSKRLQLLKELVPTASRIGFLTRKAVWEGTEAPAVVRAVRIAARAAGVHLVGLPVESPIQETGYRRVFESLASERVEAIVVQDSAENVNYRKLIIELVAQSRVPAIYPFHDFAEEGGLITYCVDLFELYRYAATQVDRILRGTPVRDVPFFQASTFKLVLNLNAAAALGMEFPPTLLSRADEVIE